MLHVLLDINCWRTDLGRCWVCQYIYNALLWTTPWRILHCSSLHHKALVSFDFFLFCQHHFELDFRELPACKSGLGDAWQQIRLWGCQEEPYGQKGQWAEELSFKSVQAVSFSWFKSKPLRSSVALKFFTVMLYPFLASTNITLCTEQFTDKCSSLSLWLYCTWR